MAGTADAWGVYDRMTESRLLTNAQYQDSESHEGRPVLAQDVAAEAGSPS